ncbi:MAG: O-antigen ligase family protein [Ferruginibacter sp.]
MKKITDHTGSKSLSNFSFGNNKFQFRLWMIIAMLVLLAIITGFFAANNMIFLMFGFTAALCSLVIIYQCFFNPVRGYYLLLVTAFFSSYPNRLLNKELPIGTFIDLLTLFLFLGTYWSAKRDENQKGNLIKYGVTILLMINIFYFLLEVFNPNMDSVSGWLFVSKRYSVYILFYIISYRLINTPERLKFFFKFWIGMAFLAAAYGCYQQWFGYLPMELRYIQDHPHEYALMFQGGVLRKISFLDIGPTFGNLCGFMTVMCVILLLNVKDKKNKYRLGFITLILFLGMSYAGIRTTTILLPTGIALYILMALKNKATLITLFTTIIAFLFLIFAPIDNPTINRMRSTFDSKDESLNVRTTNRQSIQPYLHEHPFGGGVATSGQNGVRFNPDHKLAGFPPDSALMAIVLDMGWIGLVLTMLFYLIIIYQGIYFYFRVENNEYKLYLIAVTCALFAVVISLFSTNSIDQIPNALFFYGVISLYKRMAEFDEREQNLLVVS